MLIFLSSFQESSLDNSCLNPNIMSFSRFTMINFWAVTWKKVHRHGKKSQVYLGNFKFEKGSKRQLSHSQFSTVFPITFKLFVKLYLLQNKGLATKLDTKEVCFSITLRQNTEQTRIKLSHGLIPKILD